MPSQILTAGDAISNVIRYYANQGGSVADPKTRQRAEFLLNKRGQEFWRTAPYWFKLTNNTVTLASGVGTMPSDFDNFGESGAVYVSGFESFGPLKLVQPTTIKAYLTQFNQKGRPYMYSLQGRTVTGIPQIETYPVDSSTLLIKDYVKKYPELLDHPGAPTIVASATAGLPNGSYTGKVTFVTAAGETEGGDVSAAITAGLLKIDWSDIPISQSPYVTSRKLYRPTAAGVINWKLAQTISDNITTSFLSDNVADGALGATIPTVLTAVTGMEQFPDPYHLYDGLEASFMTSQGDLRDTRFEDLWIKKCERIWSDMQQGKNQPRVMPKYGSTLFGWRPNFNVRTIGS